MTIVNVEPYGYSEGAVHQWKEAGWRYHASHWNEINEQKQQNADALIVRLSRKIGKAELDLFPNLKYLLTATTGLDHVDAEELRARNIILISLRGETEFLETIPSTAEHTWALCLALVRQIPCSTDDVKNGNWNRDRFRGYQLKGKQLGIIGLGRTGLKVASYAAVFDMKIAYYDPYVSNSSYFKYDDLSLLLAESDIISIHVHLTDETKGMLNESLIKRMKGGAFLINTSRGGLWDEQALYQLLSERQLGGIATDVLATELEDITLSPLWRAMQEGKPVIITPHIGGATWDAMWNCEEFIVKKTLQIFHGG
jgi:D-3-phosphoglycerate dehydrogenase